MPNRIMIEVGVETITVPIPGTVSQIRAIMLRFAVQRGIDVVGKTPTEIGQGVLIALLKMMRDNSVDQHRMELLASQKAAMEATIATDNPV